ncbi:NAD(P)-binding protein [Amniculicola lignicola CBS 123094]|uniref:NAD(P)-binding protein n=1 Tax=Amniculicola lignicola CBS 123094 TaxID=1392246 RepID=A0A6A5WSU9_9PLEO|nr:NAD(P)-binding protein [Amniculicola lignicola CBS 123094]
MPNVLVLGASGYMGLAVSQALLRSGTYTVFGSARTPEKAVTLRLNEITPVDANIVNPASLSAAIAAHHIDIVIDCTSAYGDASKILEGVRAAGSSRLAAFSEGNMVGPKLGFIYASGSWVHGSTPDCRVSDLTPVGTDLAPAKAAAAVGWRPAHEQAVLASRNSLDVAVLRPSLTYGRASWAWAFLGPLLSANSSSVEPIKIPADAVARTTTVHLDDLAHAFVSAADRIDGRLGSWPVFDIFTQTLPVPDILEAAKKVLSITAPLQYAGTMGSAFLEALSLVCNGENSRARSVLGWEPKRVDLIGDMPAIVMAWKAAEEAKKPST